jgi:hypothetical protein
VLQHLKASPDPRCLAPLLHVFGEGDGHGVYMLVEDAALAYPAQDLESAIFRALHSNSKWVRCWVCEIAQSAPSGRFAGPLKSMAVADDAEERAAAIDALSRVGEDWVEEFFRSRLSSERHPEVIDALRAGLADS